MDQIDREKMGRFIAERRKKLGMTQKELAEKLFLWLITRKGGMRPVEG